MSLVKSSALVSCLTMLSRLAGYARDVLIAAKLGAGAYSDAFFVAFRLPNIFRTLFAEGAFNASFVPMFNKIKEVQRAQSFAENVFSLMFVALSILTIFAQIFMPALVWVLASGFAENAEKFDLAVHLSRITFFYLLFISLGSICAGILNSMNKFVIGALAPLLLNLTLVFALLFFSSGKEVSAYALAWGVFVAGVLQLCFLYKFAAKNGFALKIKRPKIDAETRTLFRRMVPVLIGGGVLQINVLIDTQIASNISDGAVSFLYYADRISQLPLALIGTAIGVVLLPTLSKLLRDNKTEESIATQNQAIWVAMFLAIPAATGIFMLAHEIIQVLFERGNFDVTDTTQVANALLAFAVGIPAFVSAKIFTPSFYAAEDTRTPVKIAVFCIVSNVVISLSLIHFFDFNHVALAIATAASSWLNVSLLKASLTKKGLFHMQAETFEKIVKITVCSVLMALCIYGFKQIQITSSITVHLMLTIVVSGAVYIAAALLLKIISLKAILNRK